VGLGWRRLEESCGDLMVVSHTLDGKKIPASRQGPIKLAEALEISTRFMMDQIRDAIFNDAPWRHTEPNVPFLHQRFLVPK
jgi:hypothetical protein